MKTNTIETAHLKLLQKMNKVNLNHLKVMLLLLHEQKHLSFEDMLAKTKIDIKKLEETLNEMAKNKIIKQEGWLYSLFKEEELIEIITKY